VRNSAGSANGGKAHVLANAEHFIFLNLLHIGKHAAVVFTEHTYHPASETVDIPAFPDLRRAKKKPPYNGGASGSLEGCKGRRTYEWDSMHGELEVCRASDGTHLGALDPFTGERSEDPKDERSIRKKYL